MRSLYELEIRVQSSDDIGDYNGHCEITVEDVSPKWCYEPELFGDVTAAEVLAARRHMAGVLGRLMAAIVGWVDDQRLKHGCRVSTREPSPGEISVDETCFVTSSLELLNPGQDYGSSVALWLYVPDGERKTWLTRINHYLAVIAEADATDAS